MLCAPAHYVKPAFFPCPCRLLLVDSDHARLVEWPVHTNPLGRWVYFTDTSEGWRAPAEGGDTAQLFAYDDARIRQKGMVGAAMGTTPLARCVINGGFVFLCVERCVSRKPNNPQVKPAGFSCGCRGLDPRRAHVSCYHRPLTPPRDAAGLTRGGLTFRATTAQPPPQPQTPVSNKRRAPGRWRLHALRPKPPA